MDLFWSQEFVDEWNEEHSPRKPRSPLVQKCSAKNSPIKKGPKAISGRAAKKVFQDSRHRLAEDFLRELDVKITGGKLASMASSAGGIKIVWTNKLNTTAGRANWKRESMRSKQAGTEETVQHRHHASIELAEKVIDNEHRLHNVLAHEFCHLANFMVSGITGNPHGKEFKAWAAKCTKTFAARGVEVTTKHSYDIDFKYIWECSSCALEYKRHSKSINPERQRCGSCKSMLKQTKPVPRASAKPSEYQKFVSEQMKKIKEEIPGTPQKEIMRLVAERWARRGPSHLPSQRSQASLEAVDEMASCLEKLELKPLE